MIQRIQSLYLFIVTALFVSLFFTNFVVMNEIEYSVTDSVFMIIITAAIALLALGTIFCFNNRTLQVRVSIFNMVLMLGWYVMAAYVTHKDLGTIFWGGDMKIVLTFPLISIILEYLAIRGILKDDALVKSYDRLR